MARLEIRDICKSFGALVVISNVSFRLEAGERAALIGPNGAGKTTLVNIISGAIPASSGLVSFQGVDIGGTSMAQRARMGLIRTFQISRLFEALSVEENLLVALLHRDRIASRLWSRSGTGQHDEQVADGLGKLGITHLARKTVKDISLGEKRLVELSLALAMDPKLLLLDEPAAGIPRGESHMVLEAVNQLPADLAVLLIEHDMDIVFGWAKRIIVLAGGSVLADGSPLAISRDESVKRVYFGQGGEPYAAR